MRTLAVLGFIIALGLGEWAIDHIQPFFWPLVAMLAAFGTTLGLLWLYDNRPSRKRRDDAYARRHMVKR
jgi:hypothetical protein